MLVERNAVDELHLPVNGTNISEMQKIFPDVPSVLEAVPNLWAHNNSGQRCARLSRHIPISMQFRWAYLFRFATNPRHTGNSVPFCDWVKKFIREAASEEDGMANAEDGGGAEHQHVDLELSQVNTWRKTKVFEISRTILQKDLGVPPTPLMVLRKCEQILSAPETARPAKRRRPAPLP